MCVCVSCVCVCERERELKSNCLLPHTQFPFSSSSAVSSSAEATPTKEPTTVGKTVLNMEIPLYDSGPAGLGVTVFGRSTLGPAQRRGDMGIFIKSVVPGGAAALVSRWSLT